MSAREITEIEKLRRELAAWQAAVGQLDNQDARHVYAAVDAALAKEPAEAACGKALAEILRSHAGWRGRVGVDYKIAVLNEFVEGAYLAGYMEALIDHGLPTGDLVAQVEERALREGR